MGTPVVQTTAQTRIFYLSGTTLYRTHYNVIIKRGTVTRVNHTGCKVLIVSESIANLSSNTEPWRWFLPYHRHETPSTSLWESLLVPSHCRRASVGLKNTQWFEVVWDNVGTPNRVSFGMRGQCRANGREWTSSYRIPSHRTTSLQPVWKSPGTAVHEQRRAVGDTQRSMHIC